MWGICITTHTHTHTHTHSSIHTQTCIHIQTHIHSAIDLPGPTINEREFEEEISVRYGRVLEVLVSRDEPELVSPQKVLWGSL